jgi:hypothetical protein
MISSMVERFTYNERVMGSTPVSSILNFRVSSGFEPETLDYEPNELPLLYNTVFIFFFIK